MSLQRCNKKHAYLNASDCEEALRITMYVMNLDFTKYPYVYYQWQSVRGDPEHFYILVISWQFEHFWANNWQGINNSHRTIKLWFNEEKKNSFDFHHIPNYQLALMLQINGIACYYVSGGETSMNLNMLVNRSIDMMVVYSHIMDN